MKTYIKITEIGYDNGFVETPENAKMIIDQMIEQAHDCGETQSYAFHTVEMTEAEFKALPEFQGF